MSLPLVDVNSDTAVQTWPLLLEAVQKADFIALDLVGSELTMLFAQMLHFCLLQELSGLGNLMGTGRGL